MGPVILALVAIVSFMVPSVAGVAACPTALSSWVADWRATQNLLDRYGPSVEANPIIRQIGPDLYWMPIVAGTAAFCRETRTWQRASVLIWVVETWAVSNHSRAGTVESVPMLYFGWRW